MLAVFFYLYICLEESPTLKTCITVGMVEFCKHYMYILKLKRSAIYHYWGKDGWMFTNVHCSSCTVKKALLLWKHCWRH